jgi:TrmH family RNA methyltransferase
MLETQIVIVLVEPKYSGNVGAVARAMRNTGLGRLALVNPAAYDPQQARWMAPNCEEILGRVQVFSDLDSALSGVHRVIGTTARHRKQALTISTPRAMATSILEKDQITAILFGREDSGLSHSELLRCESLMRIPTPDHASLNLAQSVLLTTFCLFEEACQQGMGPTGRILGGHYGQISTKTLDARQAAEHGAELSKILSTTQDVVQLLDQVGYTRNIPEETVRLTTGKALQRSQVSEKELRGIRGMIRRIRWALNNPQSDWRSTKRELPNESD